MTSSEDPAPPADVLVTGASGFIGGHLTRRLAERGHRVRVLVRPSSDRSGFDGYAAEVATGTIDDTESVRRAAAGVRYVFHCAGRADDWGTWADFHRTNTVGAANVAAAARRAGTVERLLHVSTTDVYGYPRRPVDESAPPRDAGLPYNRSKLLGERAVREAAGDELPVTVVRPASVYGPRSLDFVVELAKLLRQGQLVYLAGGRPPAGLLYVENAADAMIDACTSPATAGRVYNLRDPGTTTWRDYLEALAAGLDVKPPRLSLPGPVAGGLATGLEAAWRLLRVRSKPPLTRHGVLLLTRDQDFPVDRARADFGFDPAVGFEEGMKRTLHWLHSAEGRRHLDD